MPDRIESFKAICRGGLNSNENHLDLAENDPGAATRLVNYEPGLYGGYRRIEGYEVYDSDYPEVGVGEAEGPVLGVVMFRNEGLGNPYLIAARKDAGANTYSFWYHTPLIGWRKLANQPARTYDDGQYQARKVRSVQFDFGSGGNVAFVDGVNSAVVFDGEDWTEIVDTEMGVVAPNVVEVFENHLFMAADPVNRSVVAYSSPSDPLDWTAAGGAGQLTLGFPVVQIKPFRDNLFIFGSNSIKKAAPDVDAGFTTDQVTTNVGCIARDSVLEIGGDLIFLAPDGFRPVAGTSRIGDVELETISKAIQGRLRDLIRYNDLDTLNGVVIRSKSQARFFVGDDSVPVSDSTGVLGGLANDGGQISWEFGDTLGIRASCCSSEYVGTEEFVLHGDYDGRVYRQERGTTAAGDPITAIYSTPYFDFGDTEIRKTLHKINTFIRAEGPFEIGISLDFDYGDPDTARPRQYDGESSGSPTQWGGRNVEYGGDYVIYGGNSKPVITTAVEGSGYSARVTFVSSGDFEPHSIQGLVLEFAQSGRR